MDAPGVIGDWSRLEDLGREVAYTVFTTELLSRVIPAALFGTLWLGPLMIDVKLGHDIAVTAAAGVLFGLCAAAGSLFIGQRLARPLRATRYRGAAHALEAELLRREPSLRTRHVWSAPLPGLVAVLSSREFVLADVSTGYVLTRMQPRAISAIILENFSAPPRRAPVPAATGGRSMMPGHADFGRARRTAGRDQKSAVVALRYHHPRTGSLRTAQIAFGSDLRAAERLTAAFCDFGANLSVSLRNTRSA